MNQLYAEAGAKKKMDANSIALRVLMGFGVLVGLFLFTLQGFYMVIGVAIIAAVIFFFPRLNVEFEYVFVDGQIDFDRIAGKAKRKTILRVDMEQMEIIAPLGSHALDSYKNMQLETKDFSSGNIQNKPFVIIASVGERKYRIIFEPSEKMLSMMKQKNPRKISLV